MKFLACKEMNSRVVSKLKQIASVAIVFCAATLSAQETANAAIENVVAARQKEKPVLTIESSAREVLAACRAMLPMKPVELKGSLILRNRKGIVSSEYDYRLVMNRTFDVSLMTIHLSPRGETNEIACATIVRRPGAEPGVQLVKNGKGQKVGSLLERVMGTDVTWLDLTFDFLWWNDAEYELEREGESVHGQKCLVILARPDVKLSGISAVRMWVDKKTGCMMQAEQVGEDGKPIRRIWGTRVKKIDGKWMVSVLEVETLGSRHRTKITVEQMREL